MSLIDLQAILLTGLILSSLYALMSTGLSLVWGSLRIFNFAHGAFMALGAYFTWTMGDRFGLNPIFSAVLGIAMMMAVGIVVERILVAPFARREDAALIAIITTLAGSIFLENGIQVVWGPRLKRLDPLFEGSIDILGTSISAQEFVIMIAAPLLLGALAIFLKRSRLGLAIRAVEQNQDAAFLIGVNPVVVYLTVFAISAAFAAAAGIMLGSTRFVTPTMGAGPLLNAFIVVILGGLGSLGGTITGAYLVGFLEAIAISMLGLYWSPVVLFSVMVLVLIIKPTGLFGVE